MKEKEEEALYILTIEGTNGAYASLEVHGADRKRPIYTFLVEA